MSSKELQSIFISNFTHKISLNSYFEKFFSNIEFDWSNFYNAYLCSFQYKIFSNILFLNKIVLFRMTNTPLCFFFVMQKKIHRCICISLNYLWQQIATLFDNYLNLPGRVPHTPNLSTNLYDAHNCIMYLIMEKLQLGLRLAIT